MELLIVIAVISALVTIMMPALSRARRVAKRTACLANLRELYHPVFDYANDNTDAVPLGYRAGNTQFNSMVYTATTQHYVLFGLLHHCARLSDPRVFFCPAETDARSQFASEVNPWPPGPEGDPTKHTYAGFGARPDVDLPDGFESSGSASPLMRLAALSNKSLLADLTALPDRLNTRHGDGVNRARGDGSADWVPRAFFDAPLMQCTAISPASNPFQAEIWRQLDAH